MKLKGKQFLYGGIEKERKKKCCENADITSFNSLL